MDFQEIWGKPSETAETLPDRAALAGMLGKESAGLLTKLRRKLQIKMFWGIAILVLCAPACFVAADHVMIWITYGLMTLMSALLMGGIYNHYRRLPSHLDMGQDPLPLLKAFHATVQRALRFEERVGAVFIMPSPALGALLGASYGSGKSVEVLLASPRMIGLLLLLMATVGPLTIWLSIWMNKVAFGKTLQRLRQNIASLEALSGNPD